MRAIVVVLWLTACAEPATSCYKPIHIGFDVLFPHPHVAVGGEWWKTPKCDTGTTSGNPRDYFQSLDIPFDVETTGRAVHAANDDSTLHLYGVEEGTGSVHLFRSDPDLDFTMPVSAGLVDTIEISPGTEPGPAAPWAWSTGSHLFVLLLSGPSGSVDDYTCTVSFPTVTKSAERTFQIDVTDA